MAISAQALTRLTDEELEAVSDEIESEARERSLWFETDASAAQSGARDKWLAENTTEVAMRLPNRMLTVLRAIAKRDGRSVDGLVKEWIHEGIMRVATEKRFIPVAR